MSNSPYQNWQGDLLDFSIKHSKQKGIIIRLLSIDPNYPNYPISLSKHGYTLVLPDMSKIGKYTYLPINKPLSYDKLLKKFNFRNTDKLLFLDPDMIFRRAFIPPKIFNNTVYGQKWNGYSEFFLKKSTIYNNSIHKPLMYPFLCNAKTLKKFNPYYIEHTIKGYLKSQEWMTEMSALVVALDIINANIIVNEYFGMCNDWKPNDNAPICHYCQPIYNKNRTKIWYKRDHTPQTIIPPPEDASNSTSREVLYMLHKFYN